VEWDGWPNVRDYTWEPYEHLDESARAYELVKIFHQETPEKPRDPVFSEDDEEEGRD
jgi:hypothetical protein